MSLAQSTDFDVFVALCFGPFSVPNLPVPQGRLTVKTARQTLPRSCGQGVAGVGRVGEGELSVLVPVAFRVRLLK